MKRIIEPLLTSLLLGSLAIMFFAGCKTPPAQNVIQSVAALAGLAAQVGAQNELARHPESRAAFTVAVEALNRMINDGTYDAAKLQAALGALPLAQFQGPNGVLYLQGAVLVFDLVLGQSFDIQSAPAVQAVAVKVRDGLVAALNAPAPRAAPVRRMTLPPRSQARRL